LKPTRTAAMKNKSTASRRHSRQNVLQVRVMTPRIAWLGFLGFFGSLTKLACVVAILAALGWGVWRGMQIAFYRNPDFRLQVIDLNANPVIDELRVASVIGIDLTSNPSLFDVDVSNATEQLKALPEITDAKLERHLPDTLVVRVTPRVPKAWIRCVEAGISEVRKTGGLLVDQDGIAYQCPASQINSTLRLPVIDLPATEDAKPAAGKRIEQPELGYTLALIKAICEVDADGMQWIDSIRQANKWSLELVTRDGTTALFGLGDHRRQIENLRAALAHAGSRGYVIDSINLIPKYNTPITIRSEAKPPKAIPVVIDETAATDRADEKKSTAATTRN
jgi:cell division septal protein FtsQ